VLRRRRSLFPPPLVQPDAREVIDSEKEMSEFPEGIVKPHHTITMPRHEIGVKIV
jgi:hypothetical protein